MEEVKRSRWVYFRETRATAKQNGECAGCGAKIWRRDPILTYEAIDRTGRHHEWMSCPECWVTGEDRG